MHDEKESPHSVERCIHDLRNELNVVMLALGVAGGKRNTAREASPARARCIELMERLSFRFKSEQQDDAASHGTQSPPHIGERNSHRE